MALTQISTAGVKDDAVTAGKIPANAVGSSELADNAVDTAAIANTAVTHDKLAEPCVQAENIGNGTITTVKIADNQITTAKIEDANVTTAKIAPDAVTGAKIADDAINSEHYTNASIDAVHIANNTITASQIANDAVGSGELASNAVTTAKIADNAITQAKINVPISNRNLVINGAMQVAQRSTSSTSSGIQTVDRFAFSRGNTSATITQAQIDIPGGFASSDPRKEGFYKSFKITNVGQSANTQGYAYIYYPIEAQHVVQSNWYFNSSSSYVTLSFWVKASVAQDYNFALFTHDGTQKEYNFVESLSANVWTKVTKTIPGDSSLTISNDNGLGMQLYWYPYIGSHYTSGSSVNQWQTHAGYTSRPDMPSTWWTTGNSTFEITGVQLEVGSTATDFEHRSYGQELQLCQRYYEENNCTWAGYTAAAQGNGSLNVTYMTPKRAAPTLSVKTAATSVQNLTSQNLQDGKIGSFVVDTRTNSTGYGRFYDLLAASDAEL